MRLEVGWTVRCQTRQARLSGFRRFGTTAEITFNICCGITSRGSRGRRLLALTLLQLLHNLMTQKNVFSYGKNIIKSTFQEPVL